MASVKQRPQGRTINNIDEVLKDEPLTREEEEALDDDKSPAERLRNIARGQQSAIVQDLPAWAKIPTGLNIPRGVEVMACNIPTRTQGDVLVVLWELSVRDERQARARAMGDGTRLVEEMAKQMIRSIGDDSVGWADPLRVERFWDDIGSKYRNVFIATYLKMHQLEDEERTDFFVNRVVARRAV